MDTKNDYRYAHMEFELGGLGLNSPKELEVYKGGYDTAINNDEMNVYKVNLWANQYCAEDIDAALAKYPNDISRAYAEVAEIYGNERICTVLNISIEAREQMQSFEKFSQETRDWGKQYELTGASAPDYLLPLESSKRPPLLITDTAILEKFVEVTRENEINRNREKSSVVYETVRRDDEITLNEANSGVSVDEKGDLTVNDERKILENTAIVPEVEDVVKAMAVKEIVAKMPTPEMMKMIENQLMEQPLEALQAVYPHVFDPDPNPERTARAERIIAGIEERSPITNEEYPAVFNEIFNKKIVEPLENTAENPLKGEFSVNLGAYFADKNNYYAEGISEKFVEDLQTVLVYNGVRNFDIQRDPDGNFDIKIIGEELAGLSENESQMLAAAHAKGVFKEWAESNDIPCERLSEAHEKQHFINQIVEEHHGLPEEYYGYDGTNGEPEDYGILDDIDREFSLQKRTVDELKQELDGIKEWKRVNLANEHDNPDFDNRSMEHGFEVPKQDYVPQGNAPKNKIDGFTETARDEKDDIRQGLSDERAGNPNNPGEVKPKNLAERLKEKKAIMAVKNEGKGHKEPEIKNHLEH